MLYADHALDKAYGQGFSYQATLPTPRVFERCGEAAAERLMATLMEERLRIGYFDLVIITNGGSSCCDLKACYGQRFVQTLIAYFRQFPHAALATVDGNDGRPPTRHSCHTTFQGQLAKNVDVHFAREFDARPNMGTRYQMQDPPYFEGPPKPE